MKHGGSDRVEAHREGGAHSQTRLTQVGDSPVMHCGLSSGTHAGGSGVAGGCDIVGAYGIAGEPGVASGGDLNRHLRSTRSKCNRVSNQSSLTHASSSQSGLNIMSVRVASRCQARLMCQATL